MKIPNFPFRYHAGTLKPSSDSHEGVKGPRRATVSISARRAFCSEPPLAGPRRRASMCRGRRPAPAAARKVRRLQSLDMAASGETGIVAGRFV